MQRLQRESGSPSELEKLQTLMEIGGIKPVQMLAGDIKEQDISNARPDLVILLKNCFKGIEGFIPNSLKALKEKGKVIGATELLRRSDPINVLGDLVGVDVEGLRKGDL